MSVTQPHMQKYIKVFSWSGLMTGAYGARSSVLGTLPPVFKVTECHTGLLQSSVGVPGNASTARDPGALRVLGVSAGTPWRILWHVLCDDCTLMGRTVPMYTYGAYIEDGSGPGCAG